MKQKKGKSKLPKEVIDFLSANGKKGGASKSAAKKKASAENVRKAAKEGKLTGRPKGSKNKPKGEKP